MRGLLWLMIGATLMPGFAPGDVSRLLAATAAPVRRPEIWSIVVGVGHYEDPRLLDSRTAARNAGEVLQWIRRAGWDRSHQLFLVDLGNADPGQPDDPRPNILPLKQNLDWAFSEWLFPRANPGDLVVIYFAGRARAVVKSQGPRVEPRVDYYLLPTDTVAGDVELKGFSLDRAVDSCVRRKIQIVCWLATSMHDGEAQPPATAASRGASWLATHTRWPGVIAWLASDRAGVPGTTDDPGGPFTGALLSSLGKRDRKRNLAACLNDLLDNPQLRLQGFRTMGDVPPQLSLWKDQFGHEQREPKPEIVLQVGHADRVTAMSASADGRHLMTASMDSTVRIWSAPDRSLLRVLPQQAVGATALALSRDERWLISGGGRGSVFVYDCLRDFATVRLATRQPHIQRVTQIALLPDGFRFVSVDRDGRSYLWDPRVSPLEPKPWPDLGPGQRPRCLEVACGGRVDTDGADMGIVLVRCGDGKVRIFDARGEGGTAVRLPRGRVTALAVGSGGHALAAGFEDGRVVILEVETFRPDERKVAPGPVRGLTFSPAGWLAVEHQNGVQLLRHGRGQNEVQPAAIDLIDRAVGRFTVSPDGRYLAVCTEDVGAVRVWRLDVEQRPQLVFDDAKARASTVTFAGDGQSLIIGGLDGSIATRLLRDAPGPGEESRVFAANRSRVQRVESTRSRRFLLLIDELNHAQVWGLEDRTCLQLPGVWTSGIFLGDNELVLTAAVDAPSHPGRLVQVRRDGNGITFNPAFYTRPNGPLQIPEHLAFEVLTLSPDGSRVAATASRSQVPLVCVWDSKMGNPTHWICQFRDPVRSLSFSSDGRHLLTAGNSPEAKLWDLAAVQGDLKTPVARLLDPNARNISCAAIRPGRNQVATGNSDGQVNLWSWKERPVKLDVQQLVAGVFAGAVKALSFTADGRYLAAAGDGTSLWVGELEPRPRAIDVLDDLRPHHHEQVNTLTTWYDRPILISGSDDMTVRFWNIKDGNLMGTFSVAAPPAVADAGATQELDWVLYTPDGRYDAPATAARRVRYRLRDQAAPLGQFGSPHNVSRLGELLLKGEKAQPEGPPPISIGVPPRLDPGSPETRLTISLGSRDLQDVRLYCNDVPVPCGWERHRGRLAEDLSFEVIVRLAPGRNRFYVTARREGASDSRSDVVEVDYVEPKQPCQLQVVAPGRMRP
jgi:WD40 repeat protein